MGRTPPLVHMSTRGPAGPDGVPGPPGPGGGVTDHGALTGLGDDDHPQYHTDARALVWLNGRSTTDLPEGTRLYFTNARADARIAAAQHDVLQGLGDDDHVQYALASKARPSPWVAAADLAGRSLGDLGTRTHALLTGLAADDHPQYHTDLRADTWFGNQDLFNLLNRHHADLQNLGLDDHPQYFLKAGRAGGQTAHGGAAAGEALTLRGNATLDSTRIILDPIGIEFPTTGGVAIQIGSGQTLTSGGQGLSINPTVNLSAPASTGITFLSTGVENVLSGGKLGQNRQFSMQRQYTLEDGIAHGTQAATEANPMATVWDSINLVANAAAATATITTLTTVRSTPTVGTGWTVTSFYTVKAGIPGGAGTITNLVALEVNDYGARATNPMSVRSAGALVQMRHRGPVVIGANAAPTNASTLLDLVSTTQAPVVPRMTTVQKNALVALKGMIVYDTTLDTFEGFQGVGAGAWAAL